MTVFPIPQFQLRPDSFGPRHYANVDGRLTVATFQGTHHVALAVPAGLFTIMKDIMDVPPGEEVKLLLMEDIEQDSVTGEDKYTYVFSLLYGEKECYDLWVYAQSTAPKWVFDPTYFV